MSWLVIQCIFSDWLVLDMLCMAQMRRSHNEMQPEILSSTLGGGGGGGGAQTDRHGELMSFVLCY